jgi:hypothetical protein
VIAFHPSFAAWLNPDHPDWSFDASSLPAIAPDASVYASVIEHATFYDLPNLELVVREVDGGRVEKSFVLLSPTEISELTDRGGQPDAIDRARELAATVQERVDVANRWLAKRRWRRMMQCKSEAPQEWLSNGIAEPREGTLQRATCGDVVLAWKDLRFSATRRAGGVLYERDARDWWEPRKEGMDQAVTSEAVLAGASLDARSGVLLVDIAFKAPGGGDAWYWDRAEHVVRLANARQRP